MSPNDGGFFRSILDDCLDDRPTQQRPANSNFNNSRGNYLSTSSQIKNNPATSKV